MKRMTLGWRRIGTKKRHQVAAQSWQQLIPSATNVEVSGTTRTSAPAEEEEERREKRERRASQEESSRTRRARGQEKGQDQKEEKARRTVVGHAEVRTSDTNVRTLEASLGRRVVSSHSVQLNSRMGGSVRCVPLERVDCQKRGEKKKSSWYLCVPKRVSLNQQRQHQPQLARPSISWPMPVELSKRFYLEQTLQQ